MNNKQPLNPLLDDEIAQAAFSDAFWRRRWIWSLLFYAALITSAITAVTRYTFSTGQLLLILLLLLANAILHAYVFLYWLEIYPNSRAQPRRMVAFLTLTTLLWLATLWFHPIFTYIWIGFGGLFFFLLNLRSAILGFAVTSAIFVFITSGATLADLDWRTPAFWIFIGGIVMSAGIAYWLQGIIVQSQERKELIQQLDNARAELATVERRAGILSERQRLAEEIHDTVAQGFISIVMHLEAAEQALPPGEPTVERHLLQARKTARESLKQARRVVEDLRPAPLEEATLPEAMQQVVTRWKEGGPETAVFTITGEKRPLSPQIEDTLLRATQEALANIRKHAQAKTVTLTLSFIGDLVLLDVQDDGRGFITKPKPDEGGFGLIAMRQRVDRLGGTVSLESEAGQGTTLAIQIPRE